MIATSHLGLLRVGGRILALVALVWLAVVAGIWLNLPRLYFYPDPLLIPPLEVGLPGTQELVLTAPDGIRLQAWWSPPAEGRPVIVYLHGKGGNLASRAPRFRIMRTAGYGVFALSNRGFGGSEGVPSETAIMADARLAYDHLMSLSVPPDRIVVFGESLGTHVAVRLATNRQVAGVVLDSPGTSGLAVARHRYPLLPVGLLLTDTFDSLSHIASVRAPLLLIHGDRDPIVPLSQGRTLYAAAHPPKQLLTLPGGGHIVRLDAGQHPPWPHIAAFITAVTAAKPPAPRP